jgi:dihydrofolate synthase/folylpolyglutamate synthase
MNYKETLEYISSINWKGSVLGLSRIRDLLEKLGNPQKELKFIHIAGTNGKGSTAAFLSSVLTEAGYKTGLFTSPYIEVYNERMQINNVNISDEELAEITTRIRPFADSMDDAPTEFELNTAICMVYFKENHCDVVVLEVGMGGELDSTNVIDSPEIAVITAIGLDHTEELGGTIEEIARTKSGIIKEGCSAVVYKQADSVMDVFQKRCEDVSASLDISEPENILFKDQDISGLTFAYPGFEELKIPLIGSYQLENVALALKTIEVLKRKGWNISDEAVCEGLKKTRWPGRFEIIAKDPLFVVDGAHNPHGIRATAASIKTYFKDKKLVYIFGVMADKDYDDMLDQILPMAQEVHAVTPDNPRALEADRLAEIIREKGVDAYPHASIEEAVDCATQHASELGTSVIALGSLYMIGDIKKYWKSKH